jgi:hypothetical protein
MRQERSIPAGLRALAAAASLALCASGAQAGAFALTADANVTGNTAAGAASIIGSFADGGDFFASPGSATGSLFFHTYGFAEPISYFGARVSGSGTFYGKTSATFTDAYTNLTGAAQLVTFSFNVDDGGLSIAGSGVGFADLDLVLQFNGITVARDRTRIESTGTGTTCDARAGDDLGVLAGYQSCNGNSDSTGSGGAYSVSRLLAVGETLDVKYQIVSEVAGAFLSGGDVLCSGGGEVVEAQAARVQAVQVVEVGVEGGEVTPGESGCTFFNVLARSGDPAQFSPVSFTPAGLQLSVPEPASMGLAGLALVGLLASRRRPRHG